MPPPYLNSEDFLAKGISKADVKDTASDRDRDCPICYNVYGGKTTRNREDAVCITACRHVFGRKCLETHVSSGHASSRLCPICRAELWKREEPVHVQQGRARGSAFSRMSMPPNARVDPGVRGPVESRPMAGGGGVGGQLANQSSFRVASQHGVAEIVEAPNSGGPAVPNGHDTSSTAMPVFYADDSARALQ